MKKLAIILLWMLGIFSVIHLTNNYTRIEENLMAIAKSSLDFIIKEEGARKTAYQDSKGLWTIGVGHLIKEDEQELLTANLSDTQVQDLLRKDLKWCSEAVESSIKVPLNQNQFDALYSLCFNIGGTNFAKSQVVKKINEKDMQGAADAILNWNKPEILINRRKRERALFLAKI